MKRTTLGAVGAALAVCATASAQDPGVKPIGISLRAGVFLPTNGDTADVIGTGFFAFGAEYTLAYKPPTLFQGTTSSATLSVDYFRREDYGNIPVLLNYAVASGRFTYSLGVGVGFTTLPNSDDSDVKFAYQLGVEFAVPNTGTLPLFVSAKYFGSENNRLNGIGLYAGVKF